MAFRSMKNPLYANYAKDSANRSMRGEGSTLYESGRTCLGTASVGFGAPKLSGVPFTKHSSRLVAHGDSGAHGEIRAVLRVIRVQKPLSVHATTKQILRRSAPQDDM